MLFSCSVGYRAIASEPLFRRFLTARVINIDPLVGCKGIAYVVADRNTITALQQEDDRRLPWSIGSIIMNTAVDGIFRRWGNLA